MRGLGAFQLAQMKHRDRRVIEMCQHLKSAIDVFQEIASEKAPSPEPPPQPTQAPPEVVREVVEPPEKLAYTLKEASAALGIGKTTLYEAIAAGQLRAVKLGNRTLIMAEALREWMATWPAVKSRR